MKALEEEQRNVESEIEESIDNKASYFRLISQHEKLDVEIMNEHDVETVIMANLENAE